MAGRISLSSSEILSHTSRTNATHSGDFQQLTPQRPFAIEFFSSVIHSYIKSIYSVQEGYLRLFPSFIHPVPSLGVHRVLNNSSTGETRHNFTERWREGDSCVKKQHREPPRRPIYVVDVPACECPGVSFECSY